MDGRDGPYLDDASIQIRQIFVEFMTKVTEFENLTAAGGNFLSRFQHSLGLLQRAPSSETSELVTSIIERNQNKRLRTYIDAGWTKVHDKVRHMCEIEICFKGIQDHINKVAQIVCEIEGLMDSTGCALRFLRESSSNVSECEEDGSTSSVGDDATEYASFMAVIGGMLKQDYAMQERIVSTLNWKTSIRELDGYCLMWSLRPFVDDDVINQALEYLS